MKKAFVFAVMVLVGVVFLVGCSRGIDDHIFSFNKDLKPGEVQKEAEISTLDGQSWNVALSFQTTFEKNKSWRGKLKDKIIIHVRIGVNPDAIDRFASSTIAYDFESKKPIGGKYSFQMDDFDMYIRDETFPLANYLFSLDKESQKKEVIHIAQQVLDVM